MTKGLNLDDLIRLLAGSVRDVQACLEDVSEAEFLKNRVIQLALVKALENIGETAGDILNGFNAFAATEPTIPWRAWKDARNRLAHGYHSIDYALVWQMAREDVTKLAISLDEMDAREVAMHSNARSSLER